MPPLYQHLLSSGHWRDELTVDQALKQCTATGKPS